MMAIALCMILMEWGHSFWLTGVLNAGLFKAESKGHFHLSLMMSLFPCWRELGNWQVRYMAMNQKSTAKTNINCFLHYTGEIRKMQKIHMSGTT